MTDTLIEKMAKAMCLVDYPHLSPDDLDGWVDNGIRSDVKPRWQWFVSKARAALAAAREPTEAMYTAGLHGDSWDGQTPTSVWQAMIDAALEEK